MSRNQNTGLYTLPARKPVNGQTIEAEDVNEPLTDIANALNQPTPLRYGGTGAVNAEAARTALGLAIGTDVQRHSDVLTTLSGFQPSQNKIPIATGSDTMGYAYLNNRNDLGGSNPDTSGVATEASIKAYADGRYAAAVSASVIPAGTIWDFGGATAPAGWIVCDGRSLSRTTYAALFAVIGTTWGSTSATTFNVPDLRRRATIGAGGTKPTGSNGPGTSLGATGGAESVSLSEGQLPAHTHGDGTLAAASSGSHSHVISAPYEAAQSTRPPLPRDDSAPSGTSDRYNNFNRFNTQSGGAHTHDVTGATGATGSGEAVGIVPPAAVVTKIIKT